MTIKTSIAVIVDAYGIANCYPESFKKKGLESVHIQSVPELLPIFKKSLQCNLYLENIAYDGNLNKILSALERYNVKCVIAGVEPGVELADMLSEKLNLRTNGTQYSLARRDKFAMAEAVRAANLPLPSYAKISSWEDLLAWKGQKDLEYPIVLKPLNSGATDGVYICQNESELAHAFVSLIEKKNILGFINKEILAQTFLKGTEFIVNSVSLNGKHYIAAILKSKKRFIKGYGFIYDREKMRKSQGRKEDALVEMHKKVLKALAIDNGPAHGEYMFTASGPILIEVAARISGGVHPAANDASVDCNQIDLSTEAYTSSLSFEQKCNKPYVRKRHFYQVLMSSSKEGKLGDINFFFEKLKQLKSYFDCRLRFAQGDNISITTNLVTSLGSVYLVHADKNIIENDYQQVLSLVENLIN